MAPPPGVDHDPTLREEGLAHDLLLLYPHIPGGTTLAAGTT